MSAQQYYIFGEESNTPVRVISSGKKATVLFDICHDVLTKFANSDKYAICDGKKYVVHTSIDKPIRFLDQFTHRKGGKYIGLEFDITIQEEIKSSDDLFKENSELKNKLKELQNKIVKEPSEEDLQKRISFLKGELILKEKANDVLSARIIELEKMIKIEKLSFWQRLYFIFYRG